MYTDAIFIPQILRKILGMDESNDSEALLLALDYHNWMITTWFATIMRADGDGVAVVQMHAATEVVQEWITAGRYQSC